jgi:hypothetical protein
MLCAASCWAIVATEVVAAAFKIKYMDKDLPKLSVQELIDYCKPKAKTMYRYSVRKALQWIKRYGGIRMEADYQFKGKKRVCKRLGPKKKVN